MAMSSADLAVGLPIVREIANQHHARGKLEDAHPGKHPPGALFTVRFEGEATP
jgi:two-component system sensor histidine kinase TctE